MHSGEDQDTTLNRKPNQGDFSASVTFIDVLFAVVMSLGLSQVMTRPWFNPTSSYIVPAYVFEILVILLGYSTLLLSWWGYHRSLRRRSNPEGGIGLAISAIDILILVGYWLLLVKFESFLFVLCVLLAIYVMYVCWDWLWQKSRPEYDLDRRRRRAVTILWTIMLGIIFAIYLALSSGGPSPAPMDWALVALSHVVNLSYRYHKEHLGFFPWKRPSLLVLKVLDLPDLSSNKKEVSL